MRTSPGRADKSRPRAEALCTSGRRPTQLDPSRERAERQEAKAPGCRADHDCKLFHRGGLDNGIGILCMLLSLLWLQLPSLIRLLMGFALNSVPRLVAVDLVRSRTIVLLSLSVYHPMLARLEYTTSIAFSRQILSGSFTSLCTSDSPDRVYRAAREPVIILHHLPLPLRAKSLVAPPRPIRSGAPRSTASSLGQSCIDARQLDRSTRPHHHPPNPSLAPLQ